MKTNTDLASMEGANGSTATRCAIYSMADNLGPLVDVAKRLDRDVYLLERGTPASLAFGGTLGTLRGQAPPDNLGAMKEIEEQLVKALRLIGLG